MTRTTEAITALEGGVNEAKLCRFWDPSSGTIIGKHTLRIKQLRVLRRQLGDYKELGVGWATMSVEGANWAAECPRVPVGRLEAMEALSWLRGWK